MNSSPPAPSITLPPLTSKGILPLTPSPTPSPADDQQSFHFGNDSSTPNRSRKGKASDQGLKRSEQGTHDIGEDGGRISMYVTLFDEMINTVLASESYLFTSREIWVLRYILDLSYEPRYLLTRLLLRRQCKIHPYMALTNAYSPELGDAGVKRAMRMLSGILTIPDEIIAQERSDPQDGLSSSSSIPGTAGSALGHTITSISQTITSTPRASASLAASTSSKFSLKGKGKVTSIEQPTPTRLGKITKMKKAKPWSSLHTGLTPAEEKADPELAEAIRESLWAAQVGRLEVDEDGRGIETPPPERGCVPRLVSGSSTTSSSSSLGFTPIPPRRDVIDNPNAPKIDEEFSLDPRLPPPIIALARDECDLSLQEIMSCISADDLRKVARGRKVPISMMNTRESVVTALVGLAKKQTVLGFAPLPSISKTKGKGKEQEHSQSKLPFFSSASCRTTVTKTVTSESLLISQLLPYLSSSAIQLTPELHSLISRVNLIFSRTPPVSSTSTSLLLPSILVQSHKRRYPSYGPPTRSTIWSSRSELLVWERACLWEGIVADALGDTWAEQMKNPTPGNWARKEILGRVEGAKVVKRIWEGVWNLWLALVEGDAGKEVDVKLEVGGLVGDRFKTGHVLTRIIYKSATAFGILHEYDEECMVLRALLRQRRWRRGKRGAWYDRLALVLMNHYNSSPEEKEEKRREAVQVCIDGLLDEDTHLIYRPALSRRLTRLENALNLPADERHISNASLLKSSVRELEAPRVAQNMGQPKLRSRSESLRKTEDRETSLGLGDEEGYGGGGRAGIQQVGKSVWEGKEGEVTVEGWVLEWWEAKGFHSESSILTTLFGLVMWPVLFTPLPGAFETPYQTAPLDLGEDTFAPSRRAMIEHRLEEMCKTAKALEMLSEADMREREKATWAVGVNWEYGREELKEILECMGGKAFSGICRMLVEEYRHRAGGVPDLIVWNYEKRTIRFIEVKGPGDSLSETQKVWIDVLLSAGVEVEVCKVKEKLLNSPQESKAIKVKRKSSALSNAEDHVKVEKKVKRSYVTGRQKNGGWGRVAETVFGSEEELDEEDGGGDEDEFRYESGEEGKGQGSWERRG